MNHTPIYILLLLALVFACDKDEISDAQSGKFIKYYSNFPEFTAADVINIPSGYAVLGTALTADSGTQICLIRTDEKGNSVGREIVYGRVGNEKAYCLKGLSDGGYIILGSSQNPVTSKLEVMVIKTNDHGQPLWTRIISEADEVEAKYFDIDNQGSIYMAGYCTTSTKGNEIWWFAIDADGEDLWLAPNRFGYNWDDEATYLDVMDNGDLLMTGYFSNGIVNNTYLLRTDGEGSPDAFLPLISTENKEGCSVTALNNNNFLILSTMFNGTYDISLDLIDYDQLQVEWTQTFITTPENEISKGLLFSNNTLYILNTKSTTASRSLISIVTADAAGNKMAVNDFGLSTGLSASSFKVTSDGGFIIAGTNALSEENNTALALIKTSESLGL